MNNREQLIQELAEIPEELVVVMLNFLHRIKINQSPHPLAKFVGILSDAEAADLQAAIKSECRQVDVDEW